MYQTEWLATGSGYDNKIGALWVNPSTCQPVGSTIAHEIGHSFQYQVYCDKILQGNPDDLKCGFRYGYEGSNGGNGFGNNVHNGNLIRTILVNCLLTIISTYGCPIVTGILNMNGCAMPVIGFSPIGLQGME